MFIEPPFYRLYHDQYCLVKYPLALGYLSGAVIKNTDWSVQTYNSDFNVEKKVFNPENDQSFFEGAVVAILDQRYRDFFRSKFNKDMDELVRLDMLEIIRSHILHISAKLNE